MWPNTKAGRFARKRNFVKFRLKGYVAQFQNMLAGDTLTNQEQEQLSEATESINTILKYWDSSTKTINRG